MSLKLRQKDELNDPQGSVQSYGFGSDLELWKQLLKLHQVVLELNYQRRLHRQQLHELERLVILQGGMKVHEQRFRQYCQLQSLMKANWN